MIKGELRLPLDSWDDDADRSNRFKGYFRLRRQDLAAWPSTRGGLGACLLAALLTIGGMRSADAGILAPIANLSVDGQFVVTKHGEAKTTKDLSGIACLPPAADGARRCVVVNDEGAAAQFVTLTREGLKPDAVFPLIGGAPDTRTIGKPPVAGCSTSGAFAEFDGEAVGFSAPYFYITGSHGCSRKEGEFRLSAFLLARQKVDTGGNPTGDVETSYRLSEWLAAPSVVQAFYGKPLSEDADGLNIEGLAVRGDELFVGLRAPSIAGQAFLIHGSAASLFSDPARPTSSRVIPVNLGPKTGIRDMTFLPDGRLLILGGPTEEQSDVAFGFFVVDLAKAPAATKLGDLTDVFDGPDRKRMKAEAVAVVGQAGDGMDLLVLWDGAKNGGPQLYHVSAP